MNKAETHRHRLACRALRIFPLQQPAGNSPPSSPSDAFVAEPETNGVIERFFRTFKEQVVRGRVYQTIDEVRGAVRRFAAHYHTQ